MYRGFKTYRHFINAKLHALSVRICGDMTVLENELEHTGKLSVTLLTDNEAEVIYNRLKGVAKNIGANINKAKNIVSSDRCSDGQRKTIIKICKYRLNWKPEATFNYIVTTIPELKQRLTKQELKRTYLEKIYTNLTSKEASLVIQRLDKLQEKNKINNSLKIPQQGGVLYESINR